MAKESGGEEGKAEKVAVGPISLVLYLLPPPPSQIGAANPTDYSRLASSLGRDPVLPEAFIQLKLALRK